jgi:CDP-glycerol glycerophosphotransferase (TagB/SpsB family)
MIQLREINPLVDHAWGTSLAEDRVWAQICGIAPSTRPWERVFVVLQAFVDDSYTPNGVFVLAGYVATAEAWAKFSDEWEKLLPLARRNNRGTHRFKMSEMTHDLEHIIPFYRVIEKYALMSLSCKIDMRDLNRAKSRVWVEDRLTMSWGPAEYPYTFCTESLLGIFHGRRVARSFSERLNEILSLDQQVDFYFDEQSQKIAILSAWENFIESHADEAKGLFGATPRFEDDEKFLPLQAADFWAWWVRRGYETNTIQKLQSGDFGLWKGNIHIPGTAIELNEDQIVQLLMMMIRRHIGHTKPIYDGKFGSIEFCVG